MDRRELHRLRQLLVTERIAAAAGLQALHHRRADDAAEHALGLMVARGLSRVAFGKPLLKLGGNLERVADARIAIDQARLLTLYAAWKIDSVGVKQAMTEISAIKVVAPNVLQAVVDQAIQLHGGAGVSDDTPLARLASAILHSLALRAPTIATTGRAARPVSPSAISSGGGSESAASNGG